MRAISELQRRQLPSPQPPPALLLLLLPSCAPHLMRPLLRCLARPMNEEWKMRPYLGVLPLVFSALQAGQTGQHSGHGRHSGASETRAGVARDAGIRGQSSGTQPVRPPLPLPTTPSTSQRSPPHQTTTHQRPTTTTPAAKSGPLRT